VKNILGFADFGIVCHKIIDNAIIAKIKSFINHE